MIDPAVERHIVDLTELVEAWRRYLDLATAAFAKPKEISHEAENEFMEVKARIAMLHDSFVEAVQRDRIIAQNMMAIVNRSITLHHLVRMSEADRKKIEIEWHEAFLLLNETVSTLQEKREELASINEFSYKMGRRIAHGRAKTLVFLKGSGFKAIVVVAVLVGLGFFVPGWMGQERWADMHLDSRVGKPIGKFYDFTRNSLGLDLPYSDLEAFKKHKLDPERLPPGWNLEGAPQIRQGVEISAGDCAQWFRDMTVEGVDGATFLDRARHSEARGVRATDQQPATLFQFWFEKASEATAFQMAHAGMAPQLRTDGAQTTAFTENNVLLIVHHRDAAIRTRVQNELF